MGLPALTVNSDMWKKDPLLEQVLYKYICYKTVAYVCLTEVVAAPIPGDSDLPRNDLRTSLLLKDGEE